MRYRFELECPRCKRESELESNNKDAIPFVNCGDCLMNDIEVVEFKIVRVHVIGESE
jgi:Zn ribbon nucleic-acid-binding protein